MTLETWRIHPEYPLYYGDGAVHSEDLPGHGEDMCHMSQCRVSGKWLIVLT